MQRIAGVPWSVFEMHKICDRECTRYALGGIRIERTEDGQPIAIATDGRRLVALSWKDGESVADGEAIVPVAICEQLTSAPYAKRNRWQPEVTLSKEPDPRTDRLHIKADSINGQAVAIAVDNIEGKFPKWRDVPPAYTAENSISISINPVLLAEILLAISAFACSEEERLVTLTLAADGENPHERPVVVTAHNRASGHNAIGVLMPFGDDRPGGAKPVPAWIPERAPEVKTATEGTSSKEGQDEVNRTPRPARRHPRSPIAAAGGAGFEKE